MSYRGCHVMCVCSGPKGYSEGPPRTSAVEAEVSPSEGRQPAVARVSSAAGATTTAPPATSIEVTSSQYNHRCCTSSRRLDARFTVAQLFAGTDRPRYTTTTSWKLARDTSKIYSCRRTAHLKLLSSLSSLCALNSVSYIPNSLYNETVIILNWFKLNNFIHRKTVEVHNKRTARPKRKKNVTR